MTFVEYETAPEPVTIVVVDVAVAGVEFEVVGRDVVAVVEFVADGAVVMTDEFDDAGKLDPVIDVDVGRGTLLVVLGRESELGEDDGDRVDDEDDESPSTVIVVELDNSEEVESIPLESAPHPASNVSAIAREAMRFIATRSDEP